MLRPGWMNRYLPPIAVATGARPRLRLFGFIWAGLMFGSAALNIALALTLDPMTWAAPMSIWGIASKVVLFLMQYATMRTIGRAAPGGGWGVAAVYLNWTPTTS